MGLFRRKNPNDRRGRWSDVLRSLLVILALYMSSRWLFWEPFVIPSGSMESTLLVQDYVLVRKWAYGLRLPFTEMWIYGPRQPRRGDIVVFKSKEASSHFLVKRVVGLPGDRMAIDDKGHVIINDTPFQYEKLDSTENLTIYRENNGEKSYRVQFLKNTSQKVETFEVPEGHIFMMGDNRNQSADSRFWGALPLERIMGKLDLIWLSCRASDQHSSFLCPPKDFRTERLFKTVH